MSLSKVQYQSLDRNRMIATVVEYFWFRFIESILDGMDVYTKYVLCNLTYWGCGAYLNIAHGAFGSLDCISGLRP
jgi:hypothetical protein